MRHTKILLSYILISFTIPVQDTARILELLKVRRDMKHNDFDKTITDLTFMKFALDLINFIEKFQGTYVKDIDSFADFPYENCIEQTVEIFKNQTNNKLEMFKEFYSIIELDSSSVYFVNDFFKYCFGYIYHYYPGIYLNVIYNKSKNGYFYTSDIYLAELIYFMNYIFLVKDVVKTTPIFIIPKIGSLNTWLSEFNFYTILPYVMWSIYPDIKTKFLLNEMILKC